MNSGTYGIRDDIIRSGEGLKLLIGWTLVSTIVGIGVFVAHRNGLTSVTAWLDLAREATVQARKEPFPFVIGGVFAIVFIGIFFKLLADTGSLVRFGVTALQLDPNPGSVGGQLGGNLRLGYSLQPGDKVTVTAVCWRHYIRKTRNKSETTRERAWSDEVHPEISQQMNQLQLYFTVDLPDAVMPSGKHGEDTYRWEVILRIDRKGRDIVRSFKVPVSAEGSPRKAARPMRTDVPPDIEDVAPGLAINEADGLLEIRGLPGRNFGMHLGLLLFGSIFAGAGVFIGYGVALENWQGVMNSSHDGFGRAIDAVFAVMSSFMALVFGVIGLLLVVSAISGARNRRELRIAAGRLSTRNRRDGKDIPLDEVESFEITESGSMGTHTIHVVRAITAGDKPLTVLEGIPGQIAMKHVRGLLERHTGKTVKILDRAERRARSRTARMRSA